MAGCQTPHRASFQARRYRIEVRLDPASHRLVGRTIVDLTRTVVSSDDAGRPLGIELLLHPDLDITAIRLSGVEGRYRGSVPSKAMNEPGFAPQRHIVVVDPPADAMTLFCDYEGSLYQDVAAGEKPGQIHNFEMRAHVGEEGVYLADGFWYPQVATDEKETPTLADFLLLVEPVDGFELVASGERDAVASLQTGRLAWRSPYPLESMVLVGGPLDVRRIRSEDLTISAYLQAARMRHAEGLIAATRRIIDCYEPLIGPFPAREFSIVENFFSSGFAFPTFTLLSSAVIDMGERSQTAHGYLDHEVLHAWWGNGVHVDPRDGNWCEALTSYAANYYGHVLDGDLEEARRKRRNYVHFLSRLEPDEDLPLGTFGQENGCGRDIAYHKGAMVFHMLARRIGQENFWAAMQSLTAKYVGSYASWDDLREVCEQAGGAKLDTFFEQWVRGGGAPLLSIERAVYDPAGHELTVTVTQDDPAFNLDVPLRVGQVGGTRDILVAVHGTREEVVIPLDVEPETVELDPDYHLFRKIPLADILPTTASTRYGSAFACVLPPDPAADGYADLQATFESSFDEKERIVLRAGDIKPGELADRCALILGQAVHDPYVSAFLGAVEFPVRFVENGFLFDAVRYGDPDDAVLCTVAHPGVPGGGITVLYANSAEAIPPAAFIPMYDRSLIIFKNKRAVLRRDFEPRRIVPVDK